jgi:anionic cell wall polymer biosynthesis LytR-Cps2A-Psr (LCP) family protein
MFCELTYSRKFKYPKLSGRFQKVLKKISEIWINFKKFLESSRRFQKVRECSTTNFTDLKDTVLFIDIHIRIIKKKMCEVMALNTIKVNMKLVITLKQQ